MHRIDLEIGGIIPVEDCHLSNMPDWRENCKDAVACQRACLYSVRDIGFLEFTQVNVGLSNPPQRQIDTLIPLVLYVVGTRTYHQFDFPFHHSSVLLRMNSHRSAHPRIAVGVPPWLPYSPPMRLTYHLPFPPPLRCTSP